MTKSKFFGGIELEYHKDLSRESKIKEMELPNKVTIPLQQHIGAICEPIIQVGDKVTAGQKIAESKEKISAPVHSSVSGMVEDIRSIPAAGGEKTKSIVIDVDETQNKEFSTPQRELDEVAPTEIIELVKEAGIVGMGGAGFPTPVKLSPPPDKTIDTIIINGCECEPYLTCDYRVMVENPDKIIKGAKILLKALDAKKCIIAIEDNKKKAINALKGKEDEKIKVNSLNTRYPQGSEKMIISALLDKEVPSGGLPSDVGVVVQNVQTITAIYDAVILDKPLIDRVITITGKNLKQPTNLLVKLGTPIKNLINQSGGITDKSNHILMGGPMMGTKISNQEIPVVKTSTGIVVLSAGEMADYSNYRNCIRCEKCIEACPMKLYPNFLSVCCEEDNLKEAYKQWDIMDCIECGICSYVCVSLRPIAQLIRQAKPEIKKMIQNEEIEVENND